MMPFRFTFLTFALVALSFSQTYADNLTLPNSSKWIVLASRETLADAKSFAQPFLPDARGVRIVRAENGRFAVILGPTDNPDISAIRMGRNIPPDTYLSSGKNFIDTVWRPDGTYDVGAVSTIDVAKCMKMAHAKARLSCFDKAHGYDGATIGDPSPLQEMPPAVHAQQNQAGNRAIGEASVVPVRQTLRLQRQDFDNDVMSDRIEMRVTFRNNTQKTVIGVGHTFTIMNAFGEAIHAGRDNLDIRLPPMASLDAPTFYFWEDNPFLNNEVYDKLQGVVANDTYKIEDVVVKVVYDDGTVDDF